MSKEEIQTQQVSCIILSTQARQPSIQNFIEEEQYANSEPLAYTDSQRYAEDDLDRLMRRNKKHMKLLEKAGDLHQRNKDKEADLERKREIIREEKVRLEQLRKRRKEQHDEKKEKLVIRKTQLSLKLDNQNIRMSDLKLTLSLLQTLNQREKPDINPTALSSFQNLISTHYQSLQHTRTSQKIRLTLQTQQRLLQNLLSIQQQLK